MKKSSSEGRLAQKNLYKYTIIWFQDKNQQLSVELRTVEFKT